jgi:hypothetical protein
VIVFTLAPLPIHAEPVDRADRVAAAEDRAEQVAYDASRERR